MHTRAQRRLLTRVKYISTREGERTLLCAVIYINLSLLFSSVYVQRALYCYIWIYGCGPTAYYLAMPFSRVLPCFRAVCAKWVGCMLVVFRWIMDKLIWRLFYVSRSFDFYNFVESLVCQYNLLAAFT